MCVFACFPCTVPVFHVYCHTCSCMFFPCVVHVLASSHCLVCFGMHLAPIFAGFVRSIFSSFSPVGHISRVYFPPIFSLCLALACFSIQPMFCILWHASIACFCMLFSCATILVSFSVWYAFLFFWHVSTTCFTWKNVQKHF